MTEYRPSHLAWHETMEMHELVSLQSIALKKLKVFSKSVQDNLLKQVYIQTISDLGQNLNDLSAFYPKTPRQEENPVTSAFDDAFYAADLLILSKTLIKSYATAITETATSSLKDTFVGHLNKAIVCHTKVFNYMLQNGMYPAYKLDQLLEADLILAKEALEE